MGVKKKTCFVVSPIGDDGSEGRGRSDKVLRHIIKPVCVELGYSASRADEINDPGLISRRIIKELIESDLVIADLTGHNPNVFYELAIRHFIGKPFVQLIEKSDGLPFDVYDLNTVRVDSADMDSVDEARSKLRGLIEAGAASGFVETPVTAVLEALGIPVPEKQKIHSVEEQLSNLTQRIVSELEQSRRERALLIEKLVLEGDRRGARKAGASIDGEESDYEGIWNSNSGLVKMYRSGDDVFGEYQFGDDVWRGDIVGKVVGEKIIFSWRWKSGEHEGIGYWERKGKALRGAWWFDYENRFGVDELIRCPEMIEEMVVYVDQIWVLSRDDRFIDELWV